MTAGRIAVVPYDPRWPLFEAERALLEHVLAPWLEWDPSRGSTAYETLKLRLAREHPDDAYTSGKRPFVAGVLARSGTEPGRR